MFKIEKCLKKEKETTRDYLHGSSEQKLLENIQHELCTQYELYLLGLNKSTTPHIAILEG